MRDKRGLVGAGIEWMIVTPIIVFILIIFLFVGFLIFQTDRLDGGGKMQLTGYSEIGQNFESVEFFEAYLNSPIEFDGEEMKMKQAFILYLDEFYNIKYQNGMSLAEYGKDNYGSVNNFGKMLFERKWEASGVHFDNSEIQKLLDKEKILREKSREIFNSLCSEYYFQAPFGTISKNEFLPDGIDELPGGKMPVFKDVRGLSKDFDPVLSMKIPYKGEVIEFKYRQLRKC